MWLSPQWAELKTIFITLANTPYDETCAFYWLLGYCQWFSCLVCYLVWHLEDHRLEILNNPDTCGGNALDPRCAGVEEVNNLFVAQVQHCHLSRIATVADNLWTGLILTYSAVPEAINSSQLAHPLNRYRRMDWHLFVSFWLLQILMLLWWLRGLGLCHAWKRRLQLLSDPACVT